MLAGRVRRAAGRPTVRWRLGAADYEAAAKGANDPPLAALFAAHVGGCDAFRACVGSMTDGAYRLLLERLAAAVAASVLRSLAARPASVSEWGALLLQRDVRALQKALAGTLGVACTWAAFADVSRAVAILNLEAPHGLGGLGDFGTLGAETVRALLRARVEWDSGAVESVAAGLGG